MKQSLVSTETEPRNMFFFFPHEMLSFFDEVWQGVYNCTALILK